MYPRFIVLVILVTWLVLCPNGGMSKECLRLQLSGGEGAEFLQGEDFYVGESSGDQGIGCAEDPEEELTCWGIPVQKSACNPGWEESNNFCYKAETIPRSWTDALADCQAQDGNLASVTSASVATFLAGLGMERKNPEIEGKWWLIGTDAKGTWTWEDGEQWNYTNWAEGEPNDGGGWLSSEVCLAINLENLAKWTDEFCSNELPYICKKQSTEASGGNYKVLRRHSGEAWILPPGWKFLSNFDPMMGTISTKLIKTQEDQQLMMDGNLVFLTRAGKNEVIEQWDHIEVASPEDNFEVPDGWEYVQIDESNFEDYKDHIGYMMRETTAQKFQNKLIKFIRKINKDFEGPTKKGELGIKLELRPDWDIHVVGNLVPLDWETVDINENNFADHQFEVSHLLNSSICRSMEKGLIKLIRRADQESEPDYKQDPEPEQLPEPEQEPLKDFSLGFSNVIGQSESEQEPKQESEPLQLSESKQEPSEGLFLEFSNLIGQSEAEPEAEPEPEQEPEQEDHLKRKMSYSNHNLIGQSEAEQGPEAEPEPEQGPKQEPSSSGPEYDSAMSGYVLKPVSEQEPSSSDPEYDSAMSGYVLKPVSEPNCANTKYGCCPDRLNPQHGDGGVGCCTASMFGCCPDSMQPAKGPYFEGCECKNYQYGCCPDKITPAKGVNNYGCGCQYTTFGCCPDQISVAFGHNYDGCACETFIFGCCTDGVTPARGPNMEGCENCGVYGCCDDLITPAYGHDKLGCGCESSYYGCCPDGSTAKGPDFRGCLTIPGENCHHPSERGSHCGEYTHKWFYDMDYGGCNRFWYGGCDPGRNHYDTEEACKMDCIAPTGSAVCFLKKVVGPCEGQYHEWYFDISVRACRPFTYSGCLGNGNRFETRESCENMCVPKEEVPVCEKTKAEGACNGYHPRWFYNKETGDCQEFFYSGCKGNNNRFISKDLCSATCLHTAKKWKSDKICKLHMEPGHCDGQNDTVARWGYSQYVRRCVPFYYLGCLGNENRFESQSDCEAVCPTTFSPIINLPSGDKMLFERGYPAEQIPVSIKANPPANVIWKHNGRDISIYDSQWRMMDDFSLQINNVADHIAGNYTVVADNGIGDPTVQNIEVIVFPVFPSVRIVIDKTIYKPKSNVIMECKVKGHPPPNIHWYKRTRRGNQERLENDGIKIYIDTIQETMLDIISRLTLRTVDTEDTAKYTCTAETDFAAPVSRSKSISVQFEPGELCMDRPSYKNCHLVVKHNFCGNKYYGRFCCRSCTDAGHIPGGAR